jgi:peptidoglycan/LPS O-acetylase OafA/YrhL
VSSKSLHVWVALCLFLAVQAVFWFGSGAPFRVRAADAIPLILGFLGPALLTAESSALGRHLWRYFGAILVALFVFDLVSAMVISKREVSMGWYIIYPLGGTVLLVLLFLHSSITKALRQAFFPVTSNPSLERP